MRGSHEAHTASTIMRATQAKQTQKTIPRPPFLLGTVAGSVTPLSRSYSSSRSTVSMAMGVPKLPTTDPRVQEGEHDVDTEVDDDVGDGGHQGHALDDQVVAGVDGLDELEADAGQLEQDLDHEGPGEQPADGEPGPGQEGEG